ARLRDHDPREEDLRIREPGCEPGPEDARRRSLGASLDGDRRLAGLDEELTGVLVRHEEVDHPQEACAADDEEAAVEKRQPQADRTPREPEAEPARREGLPGARRHALIR